MFLFLAHLSQSDKVSFRGTVLPVVRRLCILALTFSLKQLLQYCLAKFDET